MTIPKRSQIKPVRSLNSPRSAESISRSRDRFTVEMLERYLAELGDIRPFDDDFYAPLSKAFLVERKGPRVRGVREHALNACSGAARR